MSASGRWAALAAVRRAFVLGELLAEGFLCIGRALEKIERYFEFPRAGGANGDGRNGSEPLGDPKIALLHGFSFTQGRMSWLSRWKSMGASRDRTISN